MSDLISRQDAISALLEKGQRSKRYKLGEIWELNFDEIREALATVPSAEEVDELKDRLNDRFGYIGVLEEKCKNLTEQLREANLAVEHNRHVADEEQLRGQLKYRDGVIYGLKYAMRCNGVSGGEVDQ